MCVIMYVCTYLRMYVCMQVYTYECADVVVVVVADNQTVNLWRLQYPLITGIYLKLE